MNSQAEIIIRPAVKEDIQKVDAMFLKQGHGSRLEIFRQYLEEQETGDRFIFMAEQKRQVTGYLTLLKLAKHGPFAKQYPEISDFNVFHEFQCQGIGNQLMEAAERKAKDFSSILTIGVGLHKGYGTAQRMYVKRGNIPDGSGVWYENENLEENAPCLNNDELFLYFSKELSALHSC